MRSFAEQCLGLSPDAASRAATMCDLTDRDAVTYRHFRRYLCHVDEQHCARRSRQETLELGNLRASVRATLDLVDQPRGSAEEAGADSVIADALKRRGRGLDWQVDATGLAELLSDLRLPTQAAGPLSTWHAAILRVAAAGEDRGRPSLPLRAPPTYQALVEALRRAQLLLRGHLDALFGACLAAGADIESALDFALRKPSKTLTEIELAEALRVAGVDLDAFDLQDVNRVLDPHQRGIFAPELVEGYNAFKKRYGKILGSLADRLGSSRLSPDELFARAVGGRPRLAPACH